MRRKSLRNLGWSGRERLSISSEMTATAVPSSMRPHVMYGNSTPDMIDMFEGITGPWGPVRMVQPFGFSNYETAPDQATFISKIQAYYGQSEVQNVLSHGTGFITIHGAPTWLSNGVHLYGSGSAEQFVAADLAVNGTFRTGMALYLQTLQATLGALYKNPVDAQGNFDPTLPGLAFEIGNEWGNEGTTNLANAKSMYQRAWQGLHDTDPNCVVFAPSTQDYFTPAHTATSTTFQRDLLTYAVANSCPPKAVGWHNFQSTLYHLPEWQIEGMAAVRSDLIAAGLDPNLPQVLGELHNQYDVGGADGKETRAGPSAAAWLFSSLWEHWKVGGSGCCLATLKKQGTDPTDADPFAEIGTFGGFGMVTRSTVPIPCSSFTIMKLFSLWNSGQMLVEASTGRRRSGLRSFGAVSGNDLIQAVARWQPPGAAIPVDFDASFPGKTFIDARVYRIDATHNNVMLEFANTAGTDIQKATAAQVLGLNPTFQTMSSPIFSLSMANRDMVVVQFRFA